MEFVLLVDAMHLEVYCREGAVLGDQERLEQWLYSYDTIPTLVQTIAFL